MTGLRILAISLVALLASCAVSNPTLKARHEFIGIPPESAAEQITLARLAEAVEVSTDYSLRYTLLAKAAAGEYILDGTDSKGGRYFKHRKHEPVMLTYVKPAVLGSARPEVEEAPGGIHVDAQGGVALYWFWDYTPVVVPAPGVKVTLSTEPDRDRIRARQEREERERRARAQQLEEQEYAELAKRRAAEYLESLEQKLAVARTRDRVQCIGGTPCDRAFAQAQAYLLQQADMRIQVATPTLIETYAGTADGQVSMRLIRVPAAGERWEIVLSAWCREERKGTRICLEKLVDTYGGFLPHMQRP